MRRRFLELWQQAAAGQLASWEETDDGALALVIVLDQFPRNMFRGDARTFSTDDKARAVAERAIARGVDNRIDPASVGISLHAVHAFGAARRPGALRRAVSAAADPTISNSRELHADIIRRFGRFPHRNRVLGRMTSAEEQAFLDGGGSRVDDGTVTSIGCRFPPPNIVPDAHRSKTPRTFKEN